MNKTVTVTLNGQIFTLEEDAFLELQKYLDKIKEYFSANADRDEILKDIEASVAEKFSSKLSNRKEVVSKDDIEKIIGELGGIEDFAEVEEMPNDETIKEKDHKKDEQAEEIKGNKRLYRDTDDVVIAGVCSGIAAYFGIDPVFIRLLFAISIFFGGLGIFIYLILWLAVPPAKTSVQKLEMQGAEVTLKKLEEVAKEKSAEIRKKAEKEGWSSIFKIPLNFLAEVFRAIFNFLKRLFPVLGALIGGFISFAMLISIGAISVMVVLLLIGRDSGFIESDIPLEALFTTTSYYLASFSLYFLFAIPLFFIFLIGLALIRRKKVFSVTASSVLVGLWFLSLIILSAIAIDVGPRAEKIMRDWDNVELVEKEIELNDFDRLYIGDNYKAILKPGDEYRILARATQKELDKVEAEVDRGQLQLTARERNSLCLFCVNREVEFEITMPDLSEVMSKQASEVDIHGFSPDTMRFDVSGASKVTVNTGAKRIDAEINGASWLTLLGSASTTRIDMSGASKLNIDDLNLISLDLEISGASRAELKGYAERANLEVSGASKVLGLTMPMQEASVKASGASNIEIDVSDKIFVDSSGSSRVMYRGNPIVEKKELDSSMIESIDIDALDNREVKVKVIDGEGLYLDIEDR